MKSLFALGIFAILPPPAYARDSYANVHSVGIISAIGNSVSMSRDRPAGGTDRDVCLIDIADWELDDAVSGRIAALLSGRFSVRSAAFDRTTFNDPRVAGPAWTNTLMQRQHTASLPAGTDVDAYIVVSPRHLFASTGVNGGPGIFGLTVLNRAIGKPGVFALYQIDVVDARTGQQIEYALSHTGIGLLDSKEVVQDVDKSYWSATASEFPAESKQGLRSIVFDSVLNSLPYALHSAGLIHEAPQPAPPT
jgi:hypothetical protein